MLQELEEEIRLVKYPTLCKEGVSSRHRQRDALLSH